ncbi:MAG: SpoIVB peptidase [Clostridia bacterium]|nr:SpoIVB peptidase [Clostridia bacterium]
MAKKIFKGLALFLLAFVIFSAALTGTYEAIIPSSVSCYASSELPAYPLVSSCDVSDTSTLLPSSVSYKLYGIIPLKSVSVNKEDELMLYPGGMPFGVKFITEGVLVVGFCDVVSGNDTKNPSEDAGLKINDLIIKVNGTQITGAAELTRIVEESGGNSITLTYLRDGKEYETRLSPAYSAAESKYKTGIYVRDSGAGIGTVTFIVPGSYAFGGLGHGICDSQTGKLIPMQRGSVVGVTISGVVKGLAGSPGEVKGYFSSGKTGTLLGNTDCGVYGVFAAKPSSIHCEPVPVAKRNEVKEGKAYIYCTLGAGSVSKYEIEICNINREADGNKCFTVKVTDPALIEKSGGIIQGMSGSPIIQNGKLVGAVTHVLINDPATGYGIFIDNMLNQMGDLAR